MSHLRNLHFVEKRLAWDLQIHLYYQKQVEFDASYPSNGNLNSFYCKVKIFLKR